MIITGITKNSYSDLFSVNSMLSDELLGNSVFMFVTIKLDS